MLVSSVAVSSQLTCIMYKAPVSPNQVRGILRTWGGSDEDSWHFNRTVFVMTATTLSCLFYYCITEKYCRHSRSGETILVNGTTRFYTLKVKFLPVSLKNGSFFNLVDHWWVLMCSFVLKLFRQPRNKSVFSPCEHNSCMVS